MTPQEAKALKRLHRAADRPEEPEPQAPQTPQIALPRRFQGFSREQIGYLQSIASDSERGAQSSTCMLVVCVPRWEPVRIYDADGKTLINLEGSEAVIKALARCDPDRQLLCVPVPGSWMMGVSPQDKRQRRMDWLNGESEKLITGTYDLSINQALRLHNDKETEMACTNCPHPRENHGTILQGRKCMAPGCKCQMYKESQSVGDMDFTAPRLPQTVPAKMPNGTRRSVPPPQPIKPQPMEGTKPKPVDKDKAISAKDLMNAAFRKAQQGK